MDTSQLSMAEKLSLCEQVAGALCYDGKRVVDTTALYGEDTSTLLWAYVDRLQRKYHMSRISGRCSPAENLAYDIAAAEQEVEGHLQQFWLLLKGLAGEGQRVVRDPFIVYQPTGGVEIMGDNFAEGQTWYRGSDYVTDEGELHHSRRDFAASGTDRSPSVINYNHPAYAAYYTPYDPNCSCCYLHFPHTEERHRQAIANA